MALSFTTGMTKHNDADALGSVWDVPRFSGSGQAPSAALDTTVFREGAGSIGGKLAGNNWNAAITYSYYADNGSTTLDMSDTSGDEVVAIWVLMTTPGTALTLAADGGYIIVSSSTEAFDSNPTVYSEWSVAGSDKGTNGWKLFVLDVRKTASNTVGGGVDLTAVTKIGFGIRSTASVGNVKADNCFVDAIYTGNPLYTLNGDGTLVADWDDFLQHSITDENGLIEEVPGGIAISAGIAFGTDAQTATTTFDDSTGQSVIFKRHTYYTTAEVDAVDYADFYKVSAAGAASFNTSVTIGTVVGTGDDRQGVLGGQIKTADLVNMTFDVDFQTDIAHLSAMHLYGVAFAGAHGGILLDGKATAADSNAISCSFVNNGEIDPGVNSNGAEILNCSLIDPEDSGAGDNRGLRFPGATTRIKNISCITSGTPTTQHMTHLNNTGTYSIDYDNIQMFGSFATGTLWHGENSANNTNVATVNAINGSNVTEAEFDNSGTGPPVTTVVLSPVTTLIRVKHGNTLAAIQDVVVYLPMSGAGPFPYNASITISQTAGLATVAHTAHNLITGDEVVISGAVQNNYNRIKNITVTNANAYTFPIDSGTVSPATGTITATMVLLNGLTDTNGEISDTRTFSANQAVSGDADKGLSAPVFNPGVVAGNVDKDNGLTIEVFLNPDD